MAKKTKALTHRQESTKISSGRNIDGGSDCNGDDSGNDNDGDGDSGNDNDNDSGGGGGGGGEEEDKGGDTQTTIN